MRIGLTVVVVGCMFMTLTSTLEAQSIPPHVRKAIAQLAGDWTCETEIDGKKNSWELHCQLTPDKTSVTYQWSGKDINTGKQNSGSGILGWDGVKQLVVELEIYVDGTTYRSTHHILKSGKWRSPTVGSTFVDGKPVHTESLREFTFSDDGKIWRGRDINRILDGKPLPDAATICRRK